ncbi:response regulator transcription factor [Hymenobacter coalescens]
MPASESSILVAAPPSLYRQGLLTTLHDAWPDLACTVTPDAHALPALIRRHLFALVILDSALAGPPLPQVVAQLYRIRSQQTVLILTGRRLSSLHRRDLQRGGTPLLLPHHATPHEVITTVQPWLRGDTNSHLATTVPVAPSRQAPCTPFSRRELDVLRLVVGDYCNQEIANQLCLSVRTVESHRRALLQKAGARTLVGLVVQAVREGWVMA